MHHRRSIRLKDYDYRQNGAYFVTICSHARLCLFGAVVNGEMAVNDWGSIIQACWDEIPAHYPMVELDVFVVMPNHVHGIVVITGGDRVASVGA
jgi:REP element-mobilizing transposase RayT